MAKPRVFISSTFYDLKHIRSALENFIESLGYEPILSERGNIAYSHDIPLDESCYREVNNSDILVLIIGGRYGSEYSRGNKKTLDDSNTRYDSITKKEFMTAIEKQIPTYTLIERSVYSDYETYRRNKDKPVEYAHVQSTNVFNFIEEIFALPQNNPIQQFDSYSDIEIWLKEQWAGKFKELLKATSQQKQLLTLSRQVSDLSEINGTLRRYLEQIITKVIPEKSEELIKEENQRIKIFDELKKNELIGSLTGRGEITFVNISTAFNILVKSSSVEEFFDFLKENFDESSIHDFELCYEPNDWAITEFLKAKKNIEK